MRSIASLPGKFTTKTIKGIVYHYFQTMLPGGRTQIYIGPDSEEVRWLIEARKSGEQDIVVDEKMLQRLASQVIAGGVISIMPMMARIISRLADSGIFRVGGVLVGTVAYQVFGPHLGVIWGNGSRMTQNIDLASDNKIEIAVPDLKADVPAAIESLKNGFFSSTEAITQRTLNVLSY